MANVHRLGDLPQNSSSGSMQGGAKEYWDRWVNDTPVLTRTLIYVGLFTAILSLLSFSYIFGNCVSYTIESFQIWRPFTAVFFEHSFFGQLFSLFAFYTICAPFEKARGTAYLFTVFFSFAFVIELVYTAIIAFVAFNPWGNDPHLANSCSGGYWPTIFAFMVLEASENPERPKKFLCLPVEIPAKYYPWLLALLFQLLFMQGLSVDIMAGLCIGWGFGRFRNVLDFSSQTLVLMERWRIIQYLKAYPGFISVSSSGVTASGGNWGSKSYGPVASDESMVSGRGTALDEEDPRPLSFEGEGHTLGTSSGVNRAVGKGKGHVLAEKFEKEKQKTAQIEMHEKKSILDQIVEMGYARDDAEDALDVTDGDKEKALRFLKGTLKESEL